MININPLLTHIFGNLCQLIPNSVVEFNLWSQIIEEFRVMIGFGVVIEFMIDFVVIEVMIEV